MNAAGNLSGDARAVAGLLTLLADQHPGLRVSAKVVVHLGEDLPPDLAEFLNPAEQDPRPATAGKRGRTPAWVLQRRAERRRAARLAADARLERRPEPRSPDRPARRSHATPATRPAVASKPVPAAVRPTPSVFVPSGVARRSFDPEAARLRAFVPDYLEKAR